MVSRDEGGTWEDEVYYLYYGSAQSGFSQSVELDDGVILTIGVTSDYENDSAWDSWTGNSDAWAIRWRLPAEA